MFFTYFSFFTKGVKIFFINDVLLIKHLLGVIMQCVCYHLLWEYFLWKFIFGQSENDNGKRIQMNLNTSKQTSRIVTELPRASLVRYVTFCPKLITYYVYVNQCHELRNVL